MVRPALATIVALLFLFPGLSEAQFRDRMGNPAIPVTLTHPPSLGIQAKRVAFGTSSGPCADELVDMMKEDFLRNNVEVIDRENLNTLLNEHDLSLSGYVDQTSAARLGKILGPTALVFAKVQRCTAEKKPLYETRSVYREKRRINVRVNISRTQFFFRGSIQTVDLATGRIFSAKTIENSPSLQNEAEGGVAEFPSEFELQDASLRQAARAINRMFFPWREERKLIFFDDKECNLKLAYQMVKTNASTEALRISEENLTTCKNFPAVEDKTLGHAYYNAGMSYYINGRYEEALSHFQEAARLRPGDIVADAIGLVNEATASAEEMQGTEARVALEADQNAQRAEQAQADATAKQPKVMSIKDVLGMRQAGLSDELIEAQIRRNNRSFDLSTDDMLELKKHGLSDGLIRLMLDPTAALAPTVAVPPAAAPRAIAKPAARPAPAKKP